MPTRLGGMMLALTMCSAAAAADVRTGVATVYRDRTVCCDRPYNAKALAVAYYQAGHTGPWAFDTCVRIAYRQREVTAVINDNGPHIKGRVLDFTPAVSRALGFPGRASVRYWAVPCAL